eukprot:11447568-Alexandrium_andersonii.AAC.2
MLCHLTVCASRERVFVCELCLGRSARLRNAHSHSTTVSHNRLNLSHHRAPPLHSHFTCTCQPPPTLAAHPCLHLQRLLSRSLHSLTRSPRSASPVGWMGSPPLEAIWARQCSTKFVLLSCVVT